MVPGGVAIELRIGFKSLYIKLKPPTADYVLTIRSLLFNPLLTAINYLQYYQYILRQNTRMLNAGRVYLPEVVYLRRK